MLGSAMAVWDVSPHATSIRLRPRNSRCGAMAYVTSEASFNSSSLPMDSSLRDRIHGWSTPTLGNSPALMSLMRYGFTDIQNV
jgi:hypothetical protein